MISDGSPWRPLVHGLDIAQAILCVLNAPRDVVHNEIFNVGSSQQNYRVREIAEIVGDEFPGCAVSFGTLVATTEATGCRSRRSPASCLGLSASGTQSRVLLNCTGCFEASDMHEATLTGRGHTRLLQLQHLISTGQVDADLFWSHP
jgi:hypothetical protein